MVNLVENTTNQPDVVKCRTEQLAGPSRISLSAASPFDVSETPLSNEKGADNFFHLNHSSLTEAFATELLEDIPISPPLSRMEFLSETGIGNTSLFHFIIIFI
jgi:hypothetical protein